MSLSTGKNEMAPTEPSAHAGPSTELHRGQAGFDAFADRQLAFGHGPELNRCAAHNAQHPPFGLRPQSRPIDANPMNGGDLAIVDRAERGDQAGDKFGLSGILVSPRYAAVKPDDLAGHIVG